MSPSELPTRPHTAGGRARVARPPTQAEETVASGDEETVISGDREVTARRFPPAPVPADRSITVRRQAPAAADGGALTARRLTRSAEPSLILDRYRLHRRLGAGAYGVVWEARDERLERAVAIKIVPRERVIGGRFEREARAAARLVHPAIVLLYEAAADDHNAYLVSELVGGTTLEKLLEAGRLSDRDLITIGIVLCDALGHAHEQGVIHRDVKPSNVLVPDAAALRAPRSRS